MRRTEWRPAPASCVRRELGQRTLCQAHSCFGGLPAWPMSLAGPWSPQPTGVADEPRRPLAWGVNGLLSPPGVANVPRRTAILFVFDAGGSACNRAGAVVRRQFPWRALAGGGHFGRVPTAHPCEGTCWTRVMQRVWLVRWVRYPTCPLPPGAPPRATRAPSRRLLLVGNRDFYLWGNVIFICGES